MKHRYIHGIIDGLAKPVFDGPCHILPVFFRGRRDQKGHTFHERGDYFRGLPSQTSIIQKKGHYVAMRAPIIFGFVFFSFL